MNEITIPLVIVADIFGTLGMAGFMYAEIKQLRKIMVTHHTAALSMAYYKSKLFVIFCTSVMLIIFNTWVSFATILVEGVITIVIMVLIKKYRRQKE